MVGVLKIIVGLCRRASHSGPVCSAGGTVGSVTPIALPIE